MNASSLYYPERDLVHALEGTLCLDDGRSLPFMRREDSAIKRIRFFGLLRERYALLRLVGKGGMGLVFEAVDMLHSQRVAVKEMCQSSISRLHFIESIDMFRREAHFLSRLRHPNLPTMHDYFSEAGHFYFVMDFIEGQTLEDYLSRTPARKLPVKSVLVIGMQLCSVLDYLHTRPRPIIFGDLKPANIMVTPQGKLFLIDFGIARHLIAGKVQDTTINYGTPGYAAPEQVVMARTTPSSDIYSLGVTLYQLLTEDDPSWRPFHFAPLDAQSQVIPAELGQLVMRMIEPNEYSRPASVASVKRELQSIASHQTRMQMPDQGLSHMRRRMYLFCASPLRSTAPKHHEEQPIGGSEQCSNKRPTCVVMGCK